MPKKTETFGQFPPEPGSKDAETAWVEGEEKFQESLGVTPECDTDLREGDQNETTEEIEQRQAMYRTTYLNRKRTEGDTRSDTEILAELENLLKNWSDTELWKDVSPSFKKLLEEHLSRGKFSKEGRSDLDVHNAQIAWLNGLDQQE